MKSAAQLSFDALPPPVDCETLIRWESTEPARYYVAWLHYDLLGHLVLSKYWGGQGNRLGGQAHVLLNSLEEARAALDTLEKVRARHGYQRQRE